MTDLNQYARERAEFAKKLSALIFTKGGNESRWRENFNIFLCAFDNAELQQAVDQLEKVDFKDFAR